MVKIIKNNNGFTLIEVIAAIVILGFIFTPIAYLFFHTQADYNVHRREIDAQSSLSRAMRFIMDDLKRVATDQLADTTPTIQINSTNTVIVMRYDTEQVAYGVVSGEMYRFKSASIDAESITSAQLQTGEPILENVTQFLIVKNTTFYNIKLTVDPPDVGRDIVKPIQIESNYVPRFDMSIR